MEINCPLCNGIIQKNLKIYDDNRAVDIEYEIRCQHCKAIINVKIKTDTIIFLNHDHIKLSDGRTLKINNSNIGKIIG